MLSVLRHRLTALTPGICTEPAAKNAQQRLPDEHDTHLSAYRLIPASETGDFCPEDEIGRTAAMSERGGLRKSAVRKPAWKGFRPLLGFRDPASAAPNPSPSQPTGSASAMFLVDQTAIPTPKKSRSLLQMAASSASAAATTGQSDCART